MEDDSPPPASEDDYGEVAKVVDMTGQPVTPGAYRLPLTWFDDIQPQLEARDFVQGLLTDQGSAVVYGESNAGKTFWTTDLALHVASGLRYRDKRVQQGGVVYCVLEGGHGFNNRVAAWRQSKNVAGIPFVAIASALNLLDPNGDIDTLIGDIRTAAEQISVPIRLVVVDTMARALAGGDENSSVDMGLMVKNMDSLRAATGACVMYIHHSGKDAARGARGHSSLKAAIETEIEVVAGEGPEKTATVVKQRELAKGDVFGFQLDVVVLGQNQYGEDVTTCLVVPNDGVAINRKPRKQSDSERIGLEALEAALAKHGAYLPRSPEYPPDQWATTQEKWRTEFYQRVGKDANYARTYFRRATTQLVADGVIRQRNDYVWKDKAG